MSRPAVSVLMPVWNADRWLGGAMRSILSQRLHSLELLVVDDGSTDDSLRVAHEVAANDARVRVIEAGRVGLVDALEAGRAAARAPFLARMDADDLSPPDRLGAQLALMQEDERVTLCGTPVRYFPRNALGRGARNYEAWINSMAGSEQIARDLFVECPLAHPTFLARSAAVDEVGGYRDMGWPEDYDLVLRLWAAGGRFACTSGEPLAWREHPDRLSRQHARYSMDSFRRLKVHWLMERFIEPAGRSVVICGAGPTGKAFQRLLAGAGADLRAFIDVDPRKLGQDVNGARVESTAAIGDFGGSLFLGAVSGPRPRSEIRGYLEAAGLREMKDFVMVA